MFFEKWMSYIKDEAKITKIAIPGSHNAGTMGMHKVARCQNGTLFEQFQHGVRYFDIRLRADKKGLRIAHGILKGMPAKDAFASLKKILDSSDEFLVISIQTYMNQKVGPIKLSYSGNTGETDELISKYLEPEKYALTDFDDIRNITLGDIRKSGKKYIIINEKEEYKYSVKGPMIAPWDPKIFGMKPEKFVEENLKYLKNLESEGFFWFQTQQTPNLGTDVGMTWPVDLEKLSKPLFPAMMKQVADDPEMLGKVNLVAGDFMSADLMKAKIILNLNLLKGIIKDDLKEEYSAAVK
ncbi:MAG: hypothetical protein IJB45_06955 [Clostridia bacterium]|nr:hypothetical protein [Clostridia bacterium]